jgi:DNA-binding Lrp family transcriptional regulator
MSQSWRDVITVHPAADLFPLLGAAELRELAADIKANGLHEKVKIIERARRQPNGGYSVDDMEQILVDGRNRLDAMELAGLPIFSRGFSHLQRDIFDILDLDTIDNVLELNDRKIGLSDYVISMNIKRRHLTGEQKRDLIGKLMKAAPEKSDRQIADQTKASPSTVGKVRKELEQTGDVSKLDTRTDTKGRQQPASKPTKAALHPGGSTVKSSASEAAPKPSLIGSHIEPRETCLMRVRAMILDEWLPQIPQAQWVEFVRELLDEIEDIKGVIEKRTGPITIKRDVPSSVVTEITAKPNTAAEMPDLPACLDRRPPLVWKQSGKPMRFDGVEHNTHKAYTAAGDYYISIVTGFMPLKFAGYSVSFVPAESKRRDDCDLGDVRTLEDGKALAQRDYDQRMRQASGDAPVRERVLN